MTAARTLTLLLLVAALAGPAPAGEGDALRLASDAWPPFTDVEGRPRFAIEIVNEALKRSGLEAETRILTDFAQVTDGLRTGLLDGSAALWRSPERETYLLYSRPFLENRLVLVGRRGSDVSATDLAQLDGKIVALVAGYAYGKGVSDAPSVTLVKGASDQENLERLLRGEVDYMLVDDLLMQHVLTHQPEEAASALAIGRAPLVKRSLHFAVRRDLPGARFLVERFNEQIHAMLVDGTYHRILQLNWIRVDMDGDGRLELALSGNQAGRVAPGPVYAFAWPDPQPMEEEAGDDGDRYWIDGKMYDDWQSVPDQYKSVNPLPGNPDTAPPRLLRFKF